MTPGRLFRFEVRFTAAGGSFSRDTVVIPAGTPTLIASDDASSGLTQWAPGTWGVVSNDPTLYEGTDMKQPPNYTFVKGGMINFTRYLACYYGKQGVRANCISPGGFFNNQPLPFLERYEKRVPVGRMLNDEDIKGAVVFLASDASAYVTGHNLMVDGGWTSL